MQIGTGAALGLRPSPLFSRLLSAVRDARLDGEIHTEEVRTERPRKILVHRVEQVVRETEHLSVAHGVEEPDQHRPGGQSYDADDGIEEEVPASEAKPRKGVTHVRFRVTFRLPPCSRRIR